MFTIEIPLPAMSLNGAYKNIRKDKHGRGGRVKTKEARDYCENFTLLLMKYSRQIKEFLQEFDEKKMLIRADYLFYFPNDIYFTKGGNVNLKKNADTDNLIKITQDCIFSQMINDAFVKRITAESLPTNKSAHIIVKISTYEIPRALD